MTLQEAIDQAMRTHWDVHCKPSTVKAIRGTLAKQCGPILGLGLDALTHQALTEWHIQAGERTPVAANRALSYLSKALSLAVRRGDIPANPASGVRRFREKPADRYLSKLELARLAAELGSDVHSRALRFLLLTGLRSSEARGLRWRDVSPDGLEAELVDTKTGARTVALSPAAVACMGARGDGYVFPGRDGGRMDSGELWRAWKRVRAAAGLDGVRIHDLRHTFAALQVQAGTHVEVIRSLMGHASITTTQRYMHAGREQEAHALDAVAKMIGG